MFYWNKIINTYYKLFNYILIIYYNFKKYKYLYIIEKRKEKKTSKLIYNQEKN